MTVEYFMTLVVASGSCCAHCFQHYACEFGKIIRVSHKTKSDMSYTKPLQLLHVDLYGTISVQSLSGKKYILVLVDVFARYTWV